MKRRCAVLALSVLFFVGCVPTAVVVVNTAPARLDGCSIQVFASDAEVRRPFESLCIIEARNDQGGEVRTVEAVLVKAKVAACRCGADGIIVQGIEQKGMSWTSALGEASVKVKAIRFRPTEERSLESKAP